MLSERRVLVQHSILSVLLFCSFTVCCTLKAAVASFSLIVSSSQFYTCYLPFLKLSFFLNCIFNFYTHGNFAHNPSFVLLNLQFCCLSAFDLCVYASVNVIMVTGNWFLNTVLVLI